MNTLFDWTFLPVAPFWIMLIAAPRWWVTQRVTRHPAIAVGPALLYTLLAVPRLPALLPVVSQPTLASVAALLGTPDGATLGWLHFLAFDLLIAQRIHAAALARG